jgi:hypothetical protein
LIHQTSEKSPFHSILLGEFHQILTPKLWFQPTNFDVECPKDKVPRGLTSILNPKRLKHANLWQTLNLEP